MLTQDFIVNTGGRRVGHGPVAEAMATFGFNPALFRPYIGDDNHPYVDVRNSAGAMEAVRVKDLRESGVQLPPVTNSATLRRDQWVEVDRTVQRAARYQLRAWADLAAANTYGGFNGMGKLILERESMSDTGEAVQDMDTLSEDRDSDPLFQPEGLPLPITHSGFRMSARRLAVSRNGSFPLDTVKAEMAGRRVAELVEAQTIGTRTGIQYGASTGTGGYAWTRTSKVYGYTNFPQRLTKTNLTAPTGSNPEVTVAEVISMRQTLRDARFPGPFMLYHSSDWDQYLDNDYARLGGDNASMTLRDRLRRIEGIQDIRRLDLLFPSAVSAAWPGTEVDTTLKPFTLILVQMTSDVARAVNGLDLTTIQWEEKGGLELRFKVMCIWVPDLRADYYGRSGILHATTS